MEPSTYEVNWHPDERAISPVRINPAIVHEAERRKSLDGRWSFRLDPDDCGVRKRWFDKADSFSKRIQVPGCWQGQGFGHDGEEMIWDFRISARVLRATWRGTGWYARRFRVPAKWRDGRVRIGFGGVMPSAEIWLNGEHIGHHSGPFVPFAFDITDNVDWGGQNTLVVRVFERNRWMGHAYNWAGLWSGLFRGVDLTCTGQAAIEKFWVHPDVDAETLVVRTHVSDSENGALQLRLTAARMDGSSEVKGTYEVTAGEETELALPVPSPALWSPDTPNLYRVEAELVRKGAVEDALTERVGFVKLSVEGKHFLINGEPFYMRGTGDFVANPETGSPDTDRERWRKKLGRLRDFGYNYVRCQSYVPAPEYYDVADEVGLIVQSEMGMLGGWGGHSAWHNYPWPVPTPQWREPLRWQWLRTVMRDVNHPSALIYCMSNELGANTMFPRIAWQCHDETKTIRPSAFVLWTDGGSNPDLPGDFVNGDASLDAKTPLPVIQHEYRWWSAYPDPRNRKKFNGAVRPYPVEIMERAARRYGLQKKLPDMVEASQRLQYAEAHAKMELCRRNNPALAGICHFNAMDIGLSPQGILDEHYDLKITDAATWRRTNGDTVIMMDRDFDDRVLKEGSRATFTLSVSDFSHPPLQSPLLDWRLSAGEEVIGEGRVDFRHRPFRTCHAGRARVQLPDCQSPTVLTLFARLHEEERVFENAWPFWMFPKTAEPPQHEMAMRLRRPSVGSWMRTLRGVPKLRGNEEMPAVVLSDLLDEPLVAHMRKGGRVVLAATEGMLRPFPGPFGFGNYFFLPPANYPPLEDGHGGAVINSHTILGDFPHEGFADFQFYRMICNSPPIELEPLGLGRIDPVVRPLSTYFVCRPLGYLLEARLGRGGLIICAMDLDQKLPEARYLLGCILSRAASETFKPASHLSNAAVERLLAASAI